MGFWNIVNDVIEEADVLLLLLDARFVQETRNIEIENKVRRAGKPLIYVITKSDLIEDTKVLEEYKKTLVPSVFVSAREHYGTSILRDRILTEAQKAYKTKHLVKVGVLGYPNVGKSSLINSMKGSKAAPTSSMSGYTKGVQKIRADNRVIFLDTPGVIPYQEKDDFKHTLIGTIDFTKSKEPDMIVMELMQRFPGKIELFYNIKEHEDKEEALEEIALKSNILKKGGVPDIVRMSRMILKEWQSGEIAKRTKL